MRNEVFKKISQNRKRYLIENSRIETRKEVQLEETQTTVKKSKTISPYLSEKATIPKGLGISDSVTQIVRKKLEEVKWNFPFENITKKMKEISFKRHQKLRSANRKLLKGLEKMLENFVSYSNRLFEDRYITVDSNNPNINSIVLQTNETKQLIWEFADDKTHRNIIPSFHESQLGYLLNKLENMLSRIWKKTIYSLEIDGVLLELQHKKNSSTETSNKNTNAIEIKHDTSALKRVLLASSFVNYYENVSRKKHIAKIGEGISPGKDLNKNNYIGQSVSNSLTKLRNRFGYLSKKLKSIILYRNAILDLNKISAKYLHFMLS